VVPVVSILLPVWAALAVSILPLFMTARALYALQRVAKRAYHQGQTTERFEGWEVSEMTTSRDQFVARFPAQWPWPGDIACISMLDHYADRSRGLAQIMWLIHTLTSLLIVPAVFLVAAWSFQGSPIRAGALGCILPFALLLMASSIRREQHQSLTALYEERSNSLRRVNDRRPHAPV
jgi:hypothetical protein